MVLPSLEQQVVFFGIGRGEQREVDLGERCCGTIVLLVMLGMLVKDVDQSLTQVWRKGIVVNGGEFFHCTVSICVGASGQFLIFWLSIYNGQ